MLKKGTKQKQVIQNPCAGEAHQQRSRQHNQHVVAVRKARIYTGWSFVSPTSMKSCFVQFFGRNVNQFSIKSVVCQMCDKYKIWQCLHSARISVIYFFKYINIYV